MQIDLFRDLTGLPVQDFTKPGDISDFSAPMARIVHEFEDPVPVDWTFGVLLRQPGVSRLRGLVIGDWLDEKGDGRAMDRLIERLAGAGGQLPRLRFLFLSELPIAGVSPPWRGRRDLSAIWPAYPGLRLFYGRGRICRRLGSFRHCRVRRLILRPNEFVALSGEDGSVIPETGPVRQSAPQP